MLFGDGLAVTSAAAGEKKARESRKGPLPNYGNRSVLAVKFRAASADQVYERLCA